MTTGTEALKRAWRSFSTEGVPSTGENDPDKAEIRAGLDALGIDISGLVNGLQSFASVALMNADVTGPAGELAYVYKNNGSASDAANGVYQRATLNGAFELAPWYFDAVAAVVNPILDPIAETAEANNVAIKGSLPAEFTETTANGEHRAYFQIAVNTIGKTYRFWAVVRSEGRDKIQLFNNWTGIDFSGDFNLAAGTASGAGAAIFARGNNEYLVEITKVATASSVDAYIQIRGLPASGAPPYVGDTAKGFSILSAGWDEDGVTQYLFDKDDLLSATWTKEGLTASTGATKFQGIEQQIFSLLTTAGSTQPLAGKKWGAVGTSQTAFGFYTAVLAILSGMTLTNVGVSGTTFSSGGTNGVSGINTQVAGLPTDSEIVTVEGLINDHYYDAPLGSLTSTTLATFYGALYAVWVAIRTRCPDARIVYVMGTAGAGSGINAAGRNANSPNGIGLYVRDYQNAMRAFCENWNLLLSAVGQEAGINESNGDALLSDGLHYNADGGEVVGRFINTDLETMVRRGLLVS